MFRGEVVQDPLMTGGTHPHCHTRLIEKKLNRRTEGHLVTDGDQYAGLSFNNHFSTPTDIRRDDWPPRPHGLQDGIWETFPVRGEDDDIADCHQVGDIFSGAKKSHPVRNPERRSHRLQLSIQQTLADHYRQ
jgi:hypothetical protein